MIHGEHKLDLVGEKRERTQSWVGRKEGEPGKGWGRGEWD